MPRAKLSVIHPWNDTGVLAALPLPTFATDQPIRLGAIGRFAEQKGFDILIRAMRHLPASQFALILAGMGPQEAEFRAPG